MNASAQALRTTRHIACASLVGLLLGCAALTPPASDDRVVAACHPAFPDQDGWYGGDAAWSIPLEASGAATRSLWLFGDSFVERAESPGGRSYPFVHNAIGLSACDAASGFRIRFHWGGDADSPRSFFSATW